MTISKRIRERAADFARLECHRPSAPGGWCGHCEPCRIARDILAIPDDPEEGAIRAAVCEEAAALVEQDAANWQEVAQQGSDHNGPAKPWSQFAVRLDAAARHIRALAPATSGWVCVRVEDLLHVRLCDDYLDENCPRCERIAVAALPEPKEPTDG